MNDPHGAMLIAMLLSSGITYGAMRAFGFHRICPIDEHGHGDAE